MDVDNLQHLVSAAPRGSKAKVQLLLDYASGETESVPDPYLEGALQGFETVLDLVEGACQRLLEQLLQELPTAVREQ